MDRSPKLLSYLSPRSGSILIATIWILVFFSILSVGVSRIVFGQINLFRRVEGGELSTFFIRSSCRYVQKERAARKVSNDTLADLRGMRSQEFGVGRVNYNLVDEESRINVNTASADILARLPGISPDLARTITTSPLRPFSVPEELLLVEGFDQDILDRCWGWITVYSNGQVNINTAPVEVLEALGVDEALAKTIADFRLGVDRTMGTSDDGFFADPAEIYIKLKSFASLSEAQNAKLLNLIQGGLLVVASENFTLQAQTWISDKPAMKYSIVLDKYKVKRWQEQ